jgi:hypothetical protein
MPLSRREFMKTFGVGLASFILASCQSNRQKPAEVEKTPTDPVPPMIGCYEPTMVIPTHTPIFISSLAPRERLRACWLSFTELAARTKSGENDFMEGSETGPFGAQLAADHRLALDELEAAGELQPAVADLVQEAYEAAVYHVWRSNAPITCYRMMEPNYAPTSAAQLVQQSALLAEMAAKGDLNADTVAMAQKAIQHDLAFESLSDDEVIALYKKLYNEHQQNKTEIPTFEQVELEATPEVEAAAKFLAELLGKTP